MNDLQTTGGREVADYEANPFTSYGEQADRSGMPLLRFNQGVWQCGANQEDASGMTVLVDIGSLEIGWRKWADQRIAETVSGRVAENYQPPRRSELGDLDQDEWDFGMDGRTPQDPWEFFNAMPVHFRDQESPINEETALLVGNSKGFIAAVGKLSKAYGERVRQHPDELPVVQLEASSYYNKTYKRDVDVPEFAIVGWSSIEGWGANPSEDDVEEGVAETAPRSAAKRSTASRRNF